MSKKKLREYATRLKSGHLWNNIALGLEAERG